MVMLSSKQRNQYIIGVILVALLAIGLYGFLPRLSQFSSSLTTLEQADPMVVGVAAGAALLAVICAAYIYKILALHSIKLWQSSVVQFSGLFVNRVIPAGIGGLGLNYLFLRSNHHTKSQAAVVVALNNGIGLVGHVLLTVLLVLINPNIFAGFGVHRISSMAIISLLAVVVAVVIIITLYPRFTRHLSITIRPYRQHPQRLAYALLLSMALTLSNVACLWLCCVALGLPVSFTTAFVVFTFGIVAATITPTPGGLGGMEAALVGALVLAGLSAADGLAVALLFRLCSYWFGIVIGVTAFIVLRARHLVRV